MFNVPSQFAGSLPFGMFSSQEVPFGLATLQADPNCVLIQDPSAVWGAQDFLPRRNVLTYTDDWTNAAWTKSSTTAPSAGVLQCSAATAAHEARSATGPITPVLGLTYLHECKAKQGTHAYVQLSCFTGMHSTAYANFDLSTGAAGTSASCTPTISGPDADGYYTISIAVVANATPAASGFRLSIQQSASDTRQQSWAAAGTETVNVKNMSLLDPIATDRSYQAITDWTTEQYAWAAQKQVPWLRRNMLTYSEDFANAAWAKDSDLAFGSGSTIDATIAPDGTTSADLITPNTTSAFHGISRTPGITSVAGQTYTASIYVKTNGYHLQITFGSAAFGSSQYANFDLSNGAVAYSVGGLANIESAANGFFRCSFSVVSLSSTSVVSYFHICETTADTRSKSYAGNGTSGVYVWGGQLSVGSTAYQPIGASWDATYTANAIAAGYPISLWQDAAGTIAVNGDNQPIGKMLNYKLNGLYDATQATAANQPKWRLDANGKPYIERDQVNDALPITLPNLGSNCSIYIGEGSAVTESTGQTLNGSYAPLTPAADYGRVIFTTTPSYAAKVVKWLKAKAGY